MSRHRQSAVRRELAPRVFAGLILAAGMGVGGALFTLYRDVLGRPLPYADQKTLVTFWASDPERGVPRLEISYADLEEVRRHAPSLAAAEACSAANFGVVVKAPGAPAVQLQGNIVSSGFLRLLGLRPAVGRSFTAADHRAGAPGVAMLGYATWQRLFGGDRGVVGKRLDVDGTPAEVVGVLPPHVDLPVGAEVIFPLEPLQGSDPANLTQRVLMGLARLRPGVTPEAAAKEIGARIQLLEAARPNGLRQLRAAAFPLEGELLGRNRAAIPALLVMSLLVFATAVANACGVLLHRGLARRQEVAMRRALGARGVDLLRLFAGEALSIGLGAAAAASVLAAALLAAFLRLAPAGFPRLSEVGFGAETLLFVGAAAAVAGMVLTWLPFLAQGRQRSTAELLRAGAQQASLDRPTVRGLDALVVAQVAMALTLVVAAALAAGYYRSLRAIEPGFARAGVLTAHLPLPYTFGDDAETRRAELLDLLAEVEALPGVEAAGAVLMRPLEMEQGWDFTFTAEAQSVAAQERNPLGNLLSTTPDYFRAMGIALRGGRAFEAGDRTEDGKVAVVGESFARQVWGSPEAALGKRLKSGKVDSDRPWVTVVGVVADVRYRALTTAKPDIYVPFTQSIWRPNYLAIRATSEPAAAALVPEVRRLAAARFPDAPLSRPRTTGELIDAKLAQPRLDAWVLAVFSATALLLAGLGVYAVLAYLVRARRRELGIRLALGAQPRALLADVLRRSAGLVMAGALGGVALSIAAARLAAVWLPGSGGVPALEIAVACAVIALSAMTVAALPARRAAAVDPGASLR